VEFLADGGRKVAVGALTDWHATASFDPPLAPGAHAITVRLVGLDGEPLDPRVEARLSVQVR
jgi:hypothetical protein